MRGCSKIVSFPRFSAPAAFDISYTNQMARMQDKMDRIRDNPLALSIPHAITRLFREQNRLHGRAVQPFGLSTEQAHLLLVLWTYGPMTMTELGREVALSSGTLST